MNTMKQLLALLRFQFALNPVIILLPFGFIMPFYVPLFFSSDYWRGFYPDLASVVQGPDLWAVGFCAIFLAPEVARSGGSGIGSQAGLEFLLTRAVDRRLTCRARSVLYYLLMLAFPLAAYLIALSSPVLLVSEYDPVAHEQVLEHMPGAMPDRQLNSIAIPNGNTLVQSWRLWLVASAAIVTQISLYSIYPFKYRLYIFCGAIAALISLPLIADVADIHERAGSSPKATLFFAFVAHQRLCWLGAMVALLFGQLWCERRFSRTEQ